MNADIDQQIAELSRRAERIIIEEDLRKKLLRAGKTGKPMRIKFGMDPTAADVTLGHAVPLRVIRQFQDWGHKAVLIIGDYTARVGDPSGRDQTRPMLTGDEIDAHAKTYLAQVGKILLSDPDHLEIRYNGEWLAKLNLVEIIRLAGRKTVAQMLDRDSFKERFTKGVNIQLHELLYPLLQGWDSVMVNADLEMGGSDQLFNNMVGREFQQQEGGEGQIVLVTPILVGTDGTMKMSKSKGNYIALTDPPGGQTGMYGKIMRLPDALMESYFQLLTDLPKEQYRQAIAANPRAAKGLLARTIISWLHTPADADAADKEWDRIHHQGGLPEDIRDHHVAAGTHRLPVLLVRVELAASNSEAIRKIKEGAVSIDGVKVIEFKEPIPITVPVILKLGRHVVRVVPQP